VLIICAIDPSDYHSVLFAKQEYFTLSKEIICKFMLTADMNDSSAC